MRKDKELSLKWFTPDNVEWFEYSFILDKDYWYYYYWSYIDHQNLALGDWTVKLFYDGTEISTQSFKVEQVTSTTIHPEPTDCQSYKNWSLERLLASDDLDLHIFNMNGQHILKEHLPQLPSGIYFIQILKKNKSCILKRWID